MPSGVKDFLRGPWKRSPMSRVVMTAGVGPGCLNTAGKVPLRRRHEVLTAYLLLAPALLLVLGVLAYPVAWQAWVSVTNFSVARASTSFVGLSNYIGLLSGSEFWRAANRTVEYIVIAAILKLAVGVAMALALWRPFSGRPLVFLAAFLPWAYPAGVAIIGWYLFLIPTVHTAYSPLMASLHLFFDNWWGDGTWSFLSLIAFNVWRGGSFTGIFLLAAFNAIPRDLFDYAALEIRDGWRSFWMVTVPLLRPFLALALFLSLTTAVADLGNVWLLTGRRDVYPIIWTQSFHAAIFRGQLGEASALSLVLVPMLIVILIACFRLFEPLEEDPV